MSYSKRSRYSISPSPYKRHGRSMSRSLSRSRSRSRSPSVENPGNNLYVTGLSPRITKRDLEKHFSTEGKVTGVSLVVDPWTRESRGFGFVTMSSVEEAERCLKYLDRSVLEGRVITVEKAKRRRGRTPTPGKYLGLRTFGGEALVTLLDDPRVTLLIQGAEVGHHLIIQTVVGAGLILLAGGDRLLVTATGADPTLGPHIIPGVEDPTPDHPSTTMSGDDMTPDLHPLTVGLLFGEARDPTRLPTRRTTLPTIGTEEHDTLTVLFLEVPHLQGEGGEAPGEAIQEVSPVAQEGGREEATRPVFLQSLEGGQVDDILATVSPAAREGATHEVFLQK
ncbi:Serine/arginine-rich splicing factor SR45a [Linum perenne]